MLWSATVIAGRPTLLLVDASRNLAGWESGFCDRFFTTMRRRGIGLVGGGPLRTAHPEELLPHLDAVDEANCVLVVTHDSETNPPSSAELRRYWEWMDAHVRGPKLFAGCSWHSYDPEVPQASLSNAGRFAPLAVAPQSPVTPREGGLYFMKFFTELDLHAEKEISGRMAWFSSSKARELLRRRRLDGTFGVLC